MGLDTTHNCWHGPYSSFGQFRREICEAAGLGNLNDYVGFGGEKKWPENNPLVTLLYHSDCDGDIKHKDCAPLADALEGILPKLIDAGPFSTRDDAKQFIRGLRDAHESLENVEFH